MIQVTARHLPEARKRYASLQAIREDCLQRLALPCDYEELYNLRKTLEIAERGMLCALRMHGAALLEVH